jgi:ATP-binding cassette subfamily F protein 3
MLLLSGVTLRRGNKELFDGLDLAVHAGQRVGLVGRNGAGKTSLFLLVRGRLQPEDGDVKLPASWRIAHLAQEAEPSDATALDWVLDADKAYRRIERALASAEARGEHARLADLYAEFDAIDGRTAPARAGTILHGLGFSGADFARPVREFSGGWRIRLNLAQTLMTPAELLLLDEPTNHLDLDATIWLERWLTRFAGTALVISHDRDFLDRVVTHIAHLSERRVQVYRGNYTAFERQRAEAIAHAQAVAERQQVRRREIEAFVSRFRAKASKARQVQSRLKELDRLAVTATYHAETPYRFSFPSPERTSNPLLTLEDAALGYGGHVVLDGVGVQIRPGRRIGVLGRNGAGKTTLLRTIGAQMPLLAGRRTTGEHARAGYFAQHQVEQLDLAATPLANLERVAGDAGRALRTQAARTFLGGWGFGADLVLEPVRHLSGGEKARLSLALIAWQQPAILLLDEPTNHLDLDMRHALTVALQDYEGAMLIVSHDRALLRASVDEFWLVADGGVQPFDGSLDDYARWLLSRTDAGTADVAGTQAAATRRDERRTAAQRRTDTQPLRQAVKRAESQVDRLTAALSLLNARLADPALYTPARAGELREVTQQRKRFERELSDAEAQWLAAASALEAATASAGAG